MENETSDNKIKISKEIIATLPIEILPRTNRRGRLRSPSRAADAVRACLSHESIIGFDTETRPTFKKGQSNQVALMQLSTHDTCYLFRLNRIGFTPPAETVARRRGAAEGGYLAQGRLLHAGAPQQRASSPRATSWSCRRWSRRYGIEDQSLQKIYAIVLGKKISKGQRLSNWEADHLTDSQQLYAATDAWSCIKIYEALQIERISNFPRYYNNRRCCNAPNYLITTMKRYDIIAPCSWSSTWPSWPTSAAACC